MSTFDIPLGWPLPKRKEHLQKLQDLKQKGDYEHKLKFQNIVQLFNVYRIPIDLPKYRLANGRTQASQEDYLASHQDLPADFFSKDQEAEEAQLVQHELLLKMVQEGKGRELMTYFKSHQQEDPLILSHEGYMVNGNRRHCALRHLYYGDQSQYTHFSHIDVIILPPCNNKDIDELEAYLQIQPDIKQEYTWISKACMLRARQQQHGYSDDVLASLYDMNVKQVHDSLDLLAHVDDYLRAGGKEKQYHLVEKDEFAFKKLQQGRKKIKEMGKKDLFTEISYVLIEGTEEIEIEGRLYDRIPDLKENLDEIAEELKEQIDIGSTEVEQSTDYDILGISSISSLPLVEAVRNPENKVTVIEVVQDVIESEKINKRQKNKATSVLNQVSRANTSLKNAQNSINSDSEKKGVEEHLIEIENSLKELRKWLDQNA